MLFSDAVAAIKHKNEAERAVEPTGKLGFQAVVGSGTEDASKRASPKLPSTLITLQDAEEPQGSYSSQCNMVHLDFHLGESECRSRLAATRKGVSSELRLNNIQDLLDIVYFFWYQERDLAIGAKFFAKGIRHAAEAVHVFLKLFEPPQLCLESARRSVVTSLRAAMNESGQVETLCLPNGMISTSNLTHEQAIDLRLLGQVLVRMRVTAAGRSILEAVAMFPVLPLV
ncbi:TPA: hypothetical protein ACH3X1_006621 [Trebouxia sp. C0004]